ncbi:hypothetical protein ACQ86N_01155 [Puia sp. P3]|uniref:hypothetical protein n=1 Tax=Puia sp. P3 TaxID=3423952 RepID=UPI003D66AE58
MHNKIWIPISLLLLAGCANNDGPTTKLDSSPPPPDAAVSDAYHKERPAKGESQSTRTATEPPNHRAPSAADENPEEDLQTIYNDCIAEYTKTVLVDTSFLLGEDLYNLHAEHRCLMDSAIRVPKPYTRIYKLDSFVTHNFATQVRLTRNGKTILERSIHKSDFDGHLDPYLRKYGALRHPNFELKDGKILLQYSISIPLTDVGIGAYADMDKEGKIIFRDSR